MRRSRGSSARRIGRASNCSECVAETSIAARGIRNGSAWRAERVAARQEKARVAEATRQVAFRERRERAEASEREKRARKTARENQKRQRARAKRRAAIVGLIKRRIGWKQAP